MAPDLNDVLVFAAVVQAGSFTRAARALELPKSTVSRKVSELEARLGARLLQRTTRSLSLTDAGRTYFDHAQRIATELETADAAVNELEAAPRGRLRVSAPLNFGPVAPIVASFLARYPGVEVELVCTDRLVDLIEERFDVAVRASRLPDSSLVARPLGWLRSIVVASPNYLRQRKAPKRPRDLVEHDCVVFGAGVDRGTWTLTRDRGNEVVKVHGKLVTNDFDVLHAGVRQGLGLGLLPTRRVAADLEAGRLEQVLGDYCTPLLPIHAVYPSMRHLSPKVRAFIDALRAAPEAPWEPLPAPAAARRSARQKPSRS